jgi:hypothetical protein
MSILFYYGAITLGIIFLFFILLITHETIREKINKNRINKGIPPLIEEFPVFFIYMGGCRFCHYGSFT